MAQLLATSTVNDVAVTARKLEVTGADFDAGCNLAASNACGIGINMGGGAVAGTPEQFTLTDQATANRIPQVSGVIGNEGLTEVTDWPGSGGSPAGTGEEAIDAVTPSSTGDGAVTIDGTANLEAIAVGWIDTATP